MRRTITALVNNQAGVLNRIVSVLNRRQVNITSLSVGETAVPGQSWLTIVTEVQTVAESEHVLKQLAKQIDVLTVTDVTQTLHLETEIALIKVAAPGARYLDIHRAVQRFAAKVVDIDATSLVLQVSGDQEQIEACLTCLRPYGIEQVVKTVVAGVSCARPGGELLRNVRVV
ncbi:MAG: acetolactate synthase small subunit [Enterococcus sp.]